MSQVEKQKRAPMLDPIDRASEIIFGLIMALTITGSMSVATAGRDEIRTMIFGALGCNLAWGLVDAVMYLVGTLTERTRNLSLMHRVRSAATPRDAQAILADALAMRTSIVLSADALEDMWKRFVALPEPPVRGHLKRDDYISALGVLLLVVLSTFPVVVPFMLIPETLLAMRVSNAVALVTLFVAGYILGHHVGGVPWRFGIGIAAIGMFLVVVTMALGG